jgi:hypothetical protein
MRKNWRAHERSNSLGGREVGGRPVSIEAMSSVFQYSQSKLAARLVLLSIANHANDHGIAWPGLVTISKESGVSFRQIKRALRQLVEMSELRINRNASPLGTNVYVFLLLHRLFHKKDRMALPMTGCVINQRREGEPKIRPRFAQRDRELWSELHVGTGPT